MKPRRVAFPYEHRQSALWGPICRPVVHGEWYSPTLRRWIACTMVVDTGADYCILPTRVALTLGIELAQCQRHVASGIGGNQPVFLWPEAALRLGPWELRVPVGIVDRADLPPLLGRYRCLDRFDLRLRRFVTTLSAP